MQNAYKILFLFFSVFFFQFSASAQPAPPRVPSTSSTSAPSTSDVSKQPPPNSPSDPAVYAVKLRDLEQRVDELKEQIRRSHTRLSLLSDTILAAGGSGSRGIIKINNSMSRAFQINRILIVLDGVVQYNKVDASGNLSLLPEIPVYSGALSTGDHTIQIVLNLQGNGYGIFSYLKGYRFEVRSSFSFTASEGKTARIKVEMYEKGGMTTRLEDRPSIRFSSTYADSMIDSAPVDPKSTTP